VIVCGLTIDAGNVFSEKLFQVGKPGSRKPHGAKPVSFMIYFSGLAARLKDQHQLAWS